jgi:SAM-dependent methyltransferase
MAEFECGYSPNDVLGNIKAEWFAMSLAGETGGFYEHPFAPSDMANSTKKPRPNEYPARPPEEEAKLTGLPLTTGYLKGRQIINIGAGKSKLGIITQRQGADFINVDPAYGKKLQPPEGSPFVACSGENLLFPESHFDEAILLFVSCVVKDPKSVLKEAFRVVRAGGILRIYPVLVFKNPNNFPHPNMRFIRVGVDSFSIIITKDVTTDANILNLLADPETLQTKPDESTRERRFRGYFYDKEHDMPRDKWWLGDL